MPGGAAAILKPWRMAIGYIHTLLGKPLWRELAAFRAVEQNEGAVVLQQLERKLNAPLTSSCGRLFDAVAAIAGVCSVVEYEAQAAIELEAVAPPDNETTKLNSYPYSITTASTAKVVRLGELIEAVVNDARHGVAASAISGRFHMTVATIIIDMCQRLRRDAGINTVVLSGGVFQNRLLFRVAVAALEREGFHVLTHRLVPSNDGGLSLGQAVVAHFVASGRRSKACA
jgi:hydrogenase maturation protein HypF